MKRRKLVLVTNVQFTVHTYPEFIIYMLVNWVLMYINHFYQGKKREDGCVKKFSELMEMNDYVSFRHCG